MAFRNRKEDVLSLLRDERGMLGASLVWAVYFICMFNYPLFGFMVLESRANNPFNMTMLTSLSLMLTVGGLMMYRRVGWFARVAGRRSRAVSMICLASGVIIATIPSYIDVGGIALYIISGILVGFGLMVSISSWMSCLCSGSSVVSRLHIPFAFAMNALIAFFTLFLPGPVSLLVVVGLVALSYRCMISCPGVSEKETSWETLQDAQCPDRRLVGILRFEKDIVKSNIIGYGICTIALSLIYALVGQVALSAPIGYEIINRLTVFIVAVAGLLAFIIELVYKSNPDFKFIYKIIFAILATGLFFLPFFGEQYWIVFNVLVVFSFYLFFIRFMLLVSMVFRNKMGRGVAVFSITSGLVFGVSLLGVVVGTVFSHTGGFDVVRIFSIAFASVYLLAMGLLPFVRRNQEISRIDFEETDWNETKIAVQRNMEAFQSNVEQSIDKPLWSFSDDELDGLCERFGSHYRLTKREREILPFILKGKTSTEISDILVLSPSTVKGHMRMLYKKCDVHCKAELISAVERDRIIFSYPPRENP